VPVFGIGEAVFKEYGLRDKKMVVKDASYRFVQGGRFKGLL